MENAGRKHPSEQDKDRHMRTKLRRPVDAYRHASNRDAYEEVEVPKDWRSKMFPRVSTTLRTIWTFFIGALAICTGTYGAFWVGLIVDGCLDLIGHRNNKMQHFCEHWFLGAVTLFIVCLTWPVGRWCIMVTKGDGSRS